jgi:hypothetical protein
VCEGSALRQGSNVVLHPQEAPEAAPSGTGMDADLLGSARHHGATTSRSASQQITHWVWIGQELEASAPVGNRVLHGGGPVPEGKIRDRCT